MGQFLYYIPKQTDVQLEDLASWGLGHVEKRGAHQRHVENRGPDGGAGTVFVPEPSYGVKVGVFLERQRWWRCGGKGKIYHEDTKREKGGGPERIGAGGEKGNHGAHGAHGKEGNARPGQEGGGGSCWWLGMELGNAPRAESLERRVRCNTYMIKLGDGREWHVPIAKALPRRLTLTSDGDDRWQSLPEHEAFEAGARAYNDAVMAAIEAGEHGFEFDEGESVALAVAALTTLYRVSAWEVKALGLLTNENLGGVLAAVIDLPAEMAVLEAMGEASKKNECADIPGL